VQTTDLRRQRGRRSRPEAVVRVGREGQDPSIIGADDLKATFVHQPVVPVTQQDEVVEVSGPALAPGHQVVPFNLQMYVASGVA
jgi:hypothetical protein